jgi:hypothetical protein
MVKGGHLKTFVCETSVAIMGTEPRYPGCRRASRKRFLALIKGKPQILPVVDRGDRLIAANGFLDL